MVGILKIENSNINKLYLIKINKETMCSNNKLTYQDTDKSKHIQLIEEHQLNKFQETLTAEDSENTMTDFYKVIEKMKQAFESDKNYFFTFKESFCQFFSNKCPYTCSLNSLRKLSKNILD